MDFGGLFIVSSVISISFEEFQGFGLAPPIPPPPLGKIPRGDLMAGERVYNFVCSTTASIDYNFEFAICTMAPNIDLPWWFSIFFSFLSIL